MTLPPLNAAVRALWAPAPLYEAGSPRQRRPLDLFARSGGSKLRSSYDDDEQQASYGVQRDLINVLRGTTSRMVWDYAAEALTLSEEEHEYEAELEAVRSYGYSWLVPEGKQMHQEAEADDEAINEEARQAAIAAAAQTERDANAAARNAAEAAGEPIEVAASSRQSRRRRQENARISQRASRSNQNSGRNRDSMSERRARHSNGRSSASASMRPPNSRDSIGVVARAPPRTSGRYSISSSSGGGTGSAALPRYAGAMRRTSSLGVTETSAASSSAAALVAPTLGIGRDLDAEIPEAEETSYGGTNGDLGGHDTDLDDELTDLDDIDDGGDDSNRDVDTDDEEAVQLTRPRGGRRNALLAIEHTSPFFEEVEEADENQNGGQSADMDVST